MLVPTGMDADAQLECLRRKMSDLERLDGVQQRDGHASDLLRVQDAVTTGQAGHHHVRVPYRLHLRTAADRRERTVYGTAVESARSRPIILQG